MYILDRFLQPVPPGVPGELYIGGVQVARGYLNRPDLTAERFIPDQFSDLAGARLYKTGDLARYLKDGDIDFLGRLDFQVKIRGNRIELGEIESVISQHSDVREVIVVAREDTPGDQRITAYIVTDRAEGIAGSELREITQRKLPDYMVPAYFIRLEKLPRTASLKVDRKALPAPDLLETKTETVYSPPRNNIQQNIVSIWQELLKVSRVGINDNFFELGGHSLLLVQVFYRLKELTSSKLTITDMFLYPTISTLTEYLSRDSDDSNATEGRQIAEKAMARRKATMHRRREKY